MVLRLKAPSIPCSDPTQKNFPTSGFTGADCADVGSDAGCQIAAGLESGNLVRCKWAGAELLPTHQRMVVESRRWLCLAGVCFKFCSVSLYFGGHSSAAQLSVNFLECRREEAMLTYRRAPTRSSVGGGSPTSTTPAAWCCPGRRQQQTSLRKPPLNAMCGFVAFDLEKRDCVIVAPEVQWSTL